MDLLVAFGIGALIVVLLVVVLAVWRIGQVSSWRALAMIARATGSFEECVAFIRFCAQEGESREMHQFERQRRMASLHGRTRSLDEVPHASG